MGRGFTQRELGVQVAMGAFGAAGIAVVIALLTLAGLLVSAVLSLVGALVIVAVMKVCDWQTAPGYWRAYGASVAGIFWFIGSALLIDVLLPAQRYPWDPASPWLGLGELLLHLQQGGGSLAEALPTLLVRFGPGLLPCAYMVHLNLRDRIPGVGGYLQSLAASVLAVGVSVYVVGIIALRFVEKVVRPEYGLHFFFRKIPETAIALTLYSLVGAVFSAIVIFVVVRLLRSGGGAPTGGIYRTSLLGLFLYLAITSLVAFVYQDTDALDDVLEEVMRCGNLAELVGPSMAAVPFQKYFLWQLPGVLVSAGVLASRLDAPFGGPVGYLRACLTGQVAWLTAHAAIFGAFLAIADVMRPIVADYAGCRTLFVDKVTTADARSVEVHYRTSQGFETQPVRFTVHRGSRPELTGAETLLGEETVTIRAASERPEPLTLLRKTDLPLDASRPYVIVTASYGPHEVRGWFRKHTVGVAIHGYTFRYLHGTLRALEHDLVGTDWLDLLVQDLQLNTPVVEDWQNELIDRLTREACYDEASFPFNWRYDSVTPLRTILHARGKDLYDQVVRIAKSRVAEHPGDVVDLHLIGHSRGTVIVSQALLAWKRAPDPALRGSWMRATLLDPHPANNRFSPPQAPNENVDEDTTGAAWTRANYERFQDAARDPEVVLPSGTGLRDVSLWYQQERVVDIQRNPPDEDGNGIADVELRLSPMNLWGLPATSPFVVNHAGVEIRANRLRRLEPGGSGVITHTGVPIRYVSSLGPLRSPLEPPASAARGDCIAVSH